MKKKAISNLLAVIFLIAIVFISAIGFKIWNDNYNTSLMIELESSAKFEIPQIQKIAYNSNLSKIFIYNPNSYLILINNVRIDGQNCEIIGNYTLNENKLTQILINNTCSINKNSLQEVQIITEKGILQDEIIIR